MSGSLVSIVMLCWNRKDDVQESLTRFRHQKYDNFEVIVVDNCSSDGTQAMVEEEFPEVRLIKMYKNLGIEAYNIGFANARGEYIVILDDDSFPGEDAVSRMVEKFAEDEELGVVAFDVRNFYNYDDVKDIEQERNRSDTAAVAENYLMSFNGAGVGIRKDLFKQVGYYPEEFFLYWNEQDSAFRILNAGYKIKFFSDVISYHKYSPKNRSSWRAPFYYTRNAFWLVWKNYPLDMVVKLTMRMIYDCFYHTMEQKTWVYLKAMFSAFWGIGRLRGKRKAVDPNIAKNLRIPLYIAFTFYR